MSRPDPVRLRYIQALERRIRGQPEPVRQLLQQKLDAAQAAGADGAATPVPAARPARPAARETTPLAALNAYIRSARPFGASVGPLHEAEEPHELASVRRFRRAWSSSCTQDQLDQAVARKPVNAGPLNSHLLALQSLALMGDLSADYLRHFLAQVDTLQWLEGAATRSGVKPARAVKRPPRASKKAAGGEPT